MSRNLRPCRVRTFAIWALCLASIQTFGATMDYSIRVTASTQASPAQITLSWPGIGGFNSGDKVRVFRKLKDGTSFGSHIAEVTGNANPSTFVDTTVTAGVGYEYKLELFNSGNTRRANRFGFIFAGIDVPLIESRGKLILVVDSTQETALASEITRLRQDLTGDGWVVLPTISVSPSATVSSVKAAIVAAYTTDTANVRALLLLGHIPVPYSGNIAPDGHTSAGEDHQGAWPADAFYADMDGTWTDTTVNVTADARGAQGQPNTAGNNNAIGDGKYDQGSLPSEVELMLGRVDLNDLPDLFNKTETELLRQYLNKNHNWRTGQLAVERRGLVIDDFGDFGGEAFAANGFRNIACLFGTAASSLTQIASNQASTLYPTLNTNSHLLTYMSGPGFFTGLNTFSSGLISDTGKFRDNDPRSVFYLSFGSFNGDWDTRSNHLRAPLGSTTFGLASAWAGRPNWFLHHMAMGETIGFSTRLAQNNNGNNGLYYANQSGSTNPARGVHVALMGDPTLRLHPVKPPSNLSGTNLAALSWTASTETVAGYHVYRSASTSGPFTRVSANLVTGTTFTDSTTPGVWTYMVRAIKLETSPSGSYFNPSQGIFATLNVTGGNPTFTLTVNNGSGDGNYAAGTLVNISADSPSGGQVFSGWTGTTVANASASSTTLIMPAGNATVTANYTTFYLLTVNNGSGSGAYPAGTVVAITANAPTAGETFDRWTGASVANTFAATTTITVPAASTSVTATYKPVTPGNNSPVLTSGPSAAPNPASANAPVTFSASATDADGDTLTFTWTFSDGSLPANGASVVRAFPIAGTITATLVVSDGKGGSATGNVGVTIQTAVPGNNPPTVGSAAAASPNPAAVKTSVSFSVGANDLDSDPLSVLWDYGDGSSDVTGLHSYSAVGIYNVTATISDGRGGVVSSSILVTVQAGVLSQLDLDGDGFTNALEEALGTDPLNATDTPLAGVVAPNPLELTVLKAAITLSFKKASLDSAKIAGLLPVPANFSTAGTLLAVDVGGQAFAFVLAENGKALLPSGQASLKVRKKKGVVSAQNATYSISLKKTDLASALDDEGLKNADTKLANVAVIVQIFFDSAIYQASVPLKYTARANSAGRAKNTTRLSRSIDQ